MLGSALAALIKPVGTAVAKSGISAPSWMQNFVSSADPIGNYITSKGGDPLNIYGNKNNPNAFLFPGNAPGGSGGSGGASGFSPMQSGMSPQQMAMLAQMQGPQGQNALNGGFNNYLSAIGRPQMPVQQQQSQGSGMSPQLMALMQSIRGGGMPQRQGGGMPMQQMR